ncbi:helix-turn-helix domain-containing protein [Belliella aquatica]|uniref:HTH araC/xylS-type domain-containing protein n=1 Tax=Belliella aquatica TaxID=1323734 RepID=A0ABQ1MX15_9BACT|nr:AraC family transcriptional regulator [Belliella aquatica]MCH7406473.1 AraC family transcriptional regulator [Belliella aquatica]GGC46282.1 hypothetical protein GCM10010993_26110 [Belliella aquatica]
MKIYVKNMACESCKVFVINTLEELDISTVKVELGEIETKEDITLEKKKALNTKIKTVGLELLEKKQGILVEQIKKLMIEYACKSEKKPNITFSVYLSQNMNNSYSYLANFFSEVEATTIEQYMISIRVEKVKEYIVFGEYTLSEIADILHYSSVAHLSTQFKKVTGLTPSYFKALKEKRRVSIHSV